MKKNIAIAFLLLVTLGALAFAAAVVAMPSEFGFVEEGELAEQREENVELVQTQQNEDIVEIEQKIETVSVGKRGVNYRMPFEGSSDLTSILNNVSFEPVSKESEVSDLHRAYNDVSFSVRESSECVIVEDDITADDFMSLLQKAVDDFDSSFDVDGIPYIVIVDQEKRMKRICPDGDSIIHFIYENSVIDRETERSLWIRSLDDATKQSAMHRVLTQNPNMIQSFDIYPSFADGLLLVGLYLAGGEVGAADFYVYDPSTGISDLIESCHTKPSAPLGTDGLFSVLSCSRSYSIE